MRVLFFVLVVGVFSSCQKHKERKEYKKLWGTYIIESPFVIFQNSTYNVEADVLGLNEVGIGISLRGDNTEYGCEFSMLENDDSQYDYKLSFDKLRLFILSLPEGTLIEQPSPSKTELNSGRDFYLKRLTDNKISLIVKYDNGEMDIYTFNRE
jgi:hypothetical protein